MCIKTPSQTGPCNRHQGHPDPANCVTECLHRLENSVLKGDVDAVIAQAVDSYQIAVATDNPISAAEWRQQILANLGRFEELRLKWEGHHVVAGLITEAQE